MSRHLDTMLAGSAGVCYFCLIAGRQEVIDPGLLHLRVYVCVCYGFRSLGFFPICCHQGTAVIMISIAMVMSCDNAGAQSLTHQQGLHVQLFHRTPSIHVISIQDPTP